MNERSNIVLFKSRERVPSQRLRELDDGYRVATDALIIAADLGCSGDIYDALWGLCQREAERFQGRAG